MSTFFKNAGNVVKVIAATSIMTYPVGRMIENEKKRIEKANPGSEVTFAWNSIPGVGTYYKPVITKKSTQPSSQPPTAPQPPMR